MAEYIDREALIKKMRVMPIPEQAGSVNTWLDNCAAGVNAAIREVASFPAVDAIPVVRCKDCKYWSFAQSLSRYECNIFNGAYDFIGYPTKADDFCSYGERRE